MKILIFGVWALIMCSNIPGFTIERFEVKGKIESIDQGIVFVKEVENGDTLARAQIVDHVFTLSGNWQTEKEEVIPTILIALKGDNKVSVAVPLALEKQTINLLVLQDGTPTYSGSPLQDDFSSFISRTNELNQQLYDRATGDMVDSVQNQLSLQLENFYYENQNKKIKPFLALVVADVIDRRIADPADFKRLILLCTDTSSLDRFDQKICQAMSNYSDSWVNQDPGDITGITDDNVNFKMANIIGKKIVLLDFWASWCGPCIRQMDELKKLYKENNIEIVGISIDSRDEPWLKTLHNLDLQWINIRDVSGKIAKNYQVTSVPAKFVIDKSGKIIARNPGDLKTLLDSIK
jgi:thiol-disulfide isomerase/thioredoxin